MFVNTTALAGSISKNRKYKRILVRYEFNDDVNIKLFNETPVMKINNPPNKGIKEHNFT